MNIAKLKAALPDINADYLRDKHKIAHEFITKASKQVDRKYLAISMACAALAYALLFLYVYITGGAFIAKLESGLASEIVAVQNVEKEIIITQEAATSKADIIIDGLYEDTKIGRLPIIRKSDDLTSFKAYQQPFTFGESTTKPAISFVLKDYGLSKEQSMVALDLLPKEVTFLLSPYSALPDEWVKMARDKGHEVWLTLPIQNSDATDLGRNTIFHHAPINKKLDAMKRSMARSSGYVGVSSYSDQSLNTARDDYIKLADDIYERGLGFFEQNPNAPNNVIKNRAFSKSAPYIKADLEIFRIRGKYNSFETLETSIKTNGNAIAIIPSYPNAIKNLAVWITKVAQSDYVIAPLSAFYGLPSYDTRQ